MWASTESESYRTAARSSLVLQVLRALNVTAQYRGGRRRNEADRYGKLKRCRGTVSVAAFVFQELKVIFLIILGRPGTYSFIAYLHVMNEQHPLRDVETKKGGTPQIFNHSVGYEPSLADGTRLEKTK